MTETVLRVRDLHVAAGATPILRGVDFTLRRGQRMGLVGESGSGKSLTALSIMRLHRAPVRVTAGSVMLGEHDLLTLGRRQLDAIRGRRISMIYQDPAASLNPLMTIGAQLGEVLRMHTDLDRAAIQARTVELLGEVGFASPQRRVGAYPHEFSGGMRQRVMIAMALAGRPDVLLCDEPTTALDVTTQIRIMSLLDRLCAETGVAAVLITHDLGLASGFCDDIAVMYAGQLVEQAGTPALYAQPQHPYSRALMASILDLDRDIDRAVPTIPGQPPDPADVGVGCAFRFRCPLATDECATETPAPRTVGAATVRCIRAGQPQEMTSRATDAAGLPVIDVAAREART
jgi:peptide/nickel transport system ATP-binding protein